MSGVVGVIVEFNCHYCNMQYLCSILLTCAAHFVLFSKVVEDVVVEDMEVEAVEIVIEKVFCNEGRQS